MARAPLRFPAHGPDLRALLAASHREPDDDTPRLVLADWLQGHDDPRSELIRLQVRLAALPAGDPEYDALFERHQKWWKKHYPRWARDGGHLFWDSGPHDRGLPTLGHYDEESCWMETGDLGGPAKDSRDRLSATVAAGWPGMTWVLPGGFVQFDEWDEEEDDAPAAEDDPFEPFRRPPRAGSPAPVGVCFSEGMTVEPDLIDLAAKVRNIRGLSFYEAHAGAAALPRIARIKALTHLELGGLRLTDDGVRALSPLTNLRVLIARGATISNAGAAQLAKSFPELRELRLGTRRLSAAGHRAIAELSKLEVLELDKADDKTLGHLAPLTRLRRLHLAGADVSGRGVENFPLLTDLSLEATRADDAGLADLAGLTRLRMLDVSDARITGATFERLAGLRWLEDLYASETDVRDKDLVHLEGLTNLGFVSLWDTRATKKARDRLQKKLKNASVM